ncbi:3-dehydroquinate synthase [Candidatus Uhrbacteria bacterium RIFCSPLOWO2_12_FULL_46_10]|uniref:3-dehydroquinate synthase n=1 Tax=Candidatus Uhrbacteria bacterium RIFCSPLOWO2_01_FULL_47_25 TaxID=1802402 RepID=A0A1F7UYL6_9BACT|nr:MAG: 3-dehydroquinate synthase [Parcubacteria group bacterium GW2011_GWA2_46_9]OGL69458.1 MAG: 3-dehydroquinate synthase [Candidatus Uhrbacteria bacterium RIFCSPHIGHO2_02_FULL_47_29]OGL82864.1 MAG: 3-dehydroquinate synthase [Candidatus Uhrbacteria bacterium RIFCSPLOWO2_01_FULL_47_25]OGL85891.1 MAG: 3-dehydroquinate synthase [Candidatus Uhrbacteria bacterium RIFCSPLOWO2_02_FULL_46_19]OGL91060.1 MAG: 3-dehydroquinate synthase [Candidatus Uhrbacteria bacterium RIFCSPLOWO2_12_FULL_46_10]
MTGQAISTEISMNFGHATCVMHIGPGLLQQFNFTEVGASCFVLITDETVHELYGRALLQRLKDAGVPTHYLFIPDGEQSKTWDQAGGIHQQLASLEIDRKGVLIALGGGVIGDLVGFVAANYNRGIRYIQVPTTLTAQVDSSIGGKTAVNLPTAKNKVGAFWQPVAIVADTETLKTLPEREVRSGLAEVIKSAVIGDADLFQYLWTNIFMDAHRTGEFYREVVARTATIKARIVEADEREHNRRKILNFGHTIGHAVEIVTEHAVTHGEAVAIGMAYEGSLALGTGLSEDEWREMLRLLQAVNLPTGLHCDPVQLIEVMRQDKKVVDGQICFALPRKIGEAADFEGRYAIPIPVDEVRGCLYLHLD